MCIYGLHNIFIIIYVNMYLVRYSSYLTFGNNEKICSLGIQEIRYLDTKSWIEDL